LKAHGGLGEGGGNEEKKKGGDKRWGVSKNFRGVHPSGIGSSSSRKGGGTADIFSWAAKKKRNSLLGRKEADQTRGGFERGRQVRFEGGGVRCVPHQREWGDWRAKWWGGGGKGKLGQKKVFTVGHNCKEKGCCEAGNNVRAGDAGRR